MIKFSPLKHSLLEKLYRQWKAFFLSEEKFDYLFDPILQDGYYPLETERAKYAHASDYKEMFHYFPGGRKPKQLHAISKLAYKEFVFMATQILKWLDLATPVKVSRKFSMPLAEMLDVNHITLTLLRMLYYPQHQIISDEAIRAAEHEDISLITLLPAATARGLQVRNNAGEWVSISYDNSVLLVIAGDMLQICSDGYYQATTHRVLYSNNHSVEPERLAATFFVHPKPTVMLSEEYNARQIFEKRMREIGLGKSQQELSADNNIVNNLSSEK